MATTTNSPQPAITWKTRLATSLASALGDYSRRKDGTVNRRLTNLWDIQCRPNPTPIDSVSTSDVTVDPSRRLWFRLFAPSTDSGHSLPVVVFFHGGGFTFLSAASKTYDAVCRRFALEIPAFVVSVNYRLSPEHRYPAQYDDGFDILKFLDENRDSLLLPPNADLSKCFLAGDSAGANLAHHVALRASKSQFRVVRLLGLISIQPFFGGEERTESEIRLVGVPLVSTARTDWIWKAFLPDGSTRDHEAVNVSGPNGVDISGLDYPDTVVVVGGFDPLQDWQRRYYNWLKKSGKEATLIEYPNTIHAFYLFPELPEASQLTAQIKEFIFKILIPFDREY